MSLKAKIEAVIYASEEPVTLLQLVSLLGQEAQAELDAADALQGQLALLTAEPIVLIETEAGDQDALNAETLGDAIDREDEDGAQDEADAGDDKATAGAEQNSAPAIVLIPEPSPAVPPVPPAEPEPGTADAATEARARPQDARRLREYMRSVLDTLVAEYADNDRGLLIREVAGGFRFATKPEYHDTVRGFVRSLKPPLKLSLQALETLAVVAYKQPVTAPEVSEIRGVDSAGVLGSLIGRKLVTPAGRKQVIGRPILYKTTKEFLLRFGLKDVNELPSIEEFERLASDLNEAVQEEIPMAQDPETLQPADMVGDAPRGVEPSRNVHEPQADGIPNQQVDAENLVGTPNEPGEFGGDETAPPADNATVDGRLSGVPPTYDQPTVGTDSPALDAEVQASAEQQGNAGSDD